ncbi:FAD-binding domain-containing protein [Auriscalpium vulgare]|uniref:FAD-binding domain-containing protein n=1 Tax=Auriscalpium vulgare TaxID=40419 RepID=A0ACB8RXP9_9AGAM|nr:FAD-binding domain-containing protein [Auriscalpium vulgare]
MSDFASFERAFHGDLVTPSHPDYESSLKRWAANSERRAAIVAYAKDEDDVRTALLYARAQGLRIAVKGGGHNPSGASSIEGGLVIDLSRYINSVRIDPETKLGYVGGGALWRDINGAAIKHGLAMTSGTVSHTGVGGLTLGGGFGYFTGKYGLVIDHLVQATIVVASGEKLVASTSQNSDLFWALRGGGSNFGVVTEFVFQLHPQLTDVFAGFLVFAPQAMEDVMRLIEAKFDNGMTEKEMASVVAAIGPGGQPCIMMILFYDGTEEEGREHFKPFFELKHIVADMCRGMPYDESNTLQDAGTPHGSNYYLRSVSIPRPSTKMALQVRDAVFELSEANPDIHTTCVFEHWSLAKVLSVPPEATSFNRSEKLSIVIAIQYDNDTPDSLRRVREIVDKLMKIAGGDARKNIGYANFNSDAPSHYASSADVVLSEEQTKALFGSNIARLRQIKKRYDPDMVFAKWFAIKPAA